MTQRWAIFLLTLLSLFTALPAQAHGGHGPSVVRAGEFCGTAPPPSVVCPRTGGSECRCYLSSVAPSGEIAVTFERLEPLRVKKPGAPRVRVLEAVEYRPLFSSLTGSRLDRPPRV